MWGLWFPTFLDLITALTSHHPFSTRQPPWRSKQLYTGTQLCLLNVRLVSKSNWRKQTGLESVPSYGGRKHKETFQIINHPLSAKFREIWLFNHLEQQGLHTFKQEKQLRVYLELRRCYFYYVIRRNIVESKSNLWKGLRSEASDPIF